MIHAEATIFCHDDKAMSVQIPRGTVLYCTRMTTTTFSVRVGRSTKSRLEKLAKSTGRSRSFLAAEAIVAYLDTNEWQVAGIQKALSSLDRRKGISHPHVSEWIASWETRKERPAHCALTFEVRPYLQVSRAWGQGGDNIVGGDGSADALEFKLPNRLDGYGVLDRHQNTRANQNLTGLSFVAQPGCDIGHRPDSGIIEASFEADSAERGMPVRYADTKADLVAQPPPLVRQRSDGVAHI
jgi:RHH-type rel operon transcriptional repressor/antitoxin RelB